MPGALVRIDESVSTPPVHLQTRLLGEPGPGGDTGPEENGPRGDHLTTLHGQLVTVVHASYAFEARAKAQIHAVVAQPTLDAFPDLAAEALPLRRLFEADEGYVRAAQREGGRGLAPDKTAADDDGLTSISDAASKPGRVLDGP
jgi:hypothetical protein